MSSIHADAPPPIVSEPTGTNYATGTMLGKGGFAICYRGERYNGSKPTGQIVALKIVKTRMEPAKLAQKFVTELQIHSKLSHPNIVTFYRAFSFSTSTYVVLELCPNGSLADLLKKRRQLTLPEIRRLVIQICGAVKYLHHRHIVHRDLKTGNLFLDGKMNVKVGDFGLAALLVTGREMEHTRRTTMCGTPNYLAPEILEKGKGHDEKVDLWAIGVIAYTLAVGKAPFHASTKEEIYKKLRTGEYAWPELNAAVNQSSDLRDLVSSLLVPEEQRPSPDKIVSHSFFRIAFVPANLPESAREKAPVWPDVCIPSAEVIRRGYSETWFEICKQSGVGEYAEGKCFPLNGGRKVRSVVHDITRECQAGTQPVMPIPQDVVYTSNVNDLDGQIAGSKISDAPRILTMARKGFRETSDESMKPPARGGLKEISHNEVAASRSRIGESTRAVGDAELMPPPARATSRVGRAGTMRKAARTISEEAASSADSVKIMSDPSLGRSTSIRVSKTRPIPGSGSSTAALKESNLSGGTGKQTAPSQQPQEEKPSRSQTTKRSADASLARRPRGTKTTRERPLSPVEVAEPVPTVETRGARPRSPATRAGAFATLDELKQVSPFKPKKKTAQAEVIEILSDHESDGRDEPAPALTSTVKLPPPPKMNRPLPAPRRTLSLEVDPAIQGSDPRSVLERLATFRDNLASAISHPSSAGSSSLGVEERLPFVSRWVDYSRKHGVGYVLSDGTVGCIINASQAKPDGTAPANPVTHVLVRHGQRWLQKVGSKSKDFAGIDQIPLEILEDREAEGVKRKVYKGLGSVKEGPLLAEAERRRTLSVLWVKFGRYMCQSLESTGEAERPSSSAAGGQGENFVRCYQRIGAVGLWAFADGCLQAHFPDHTKLVIGADGRVVSATLLSVEATQHLRRNGELLPPHVAGRHVLAGSIAGLLGDLGRVRRPLVRANALKEKLSFILRVVEQWVHNEGLGRLDEDREGHELGGEGLGGDGLCWEGLGMKDSVKKTDRVTVGRYGGDDRRV